jgi:histone acetyltransferase (RNA polymerase elongator complex component)
MGLYTKLADDIDEVDIIIAGGTFTHFLTPSLG